MKGIGISLIVVGVIGALLATAMFGDIGLAAMIGAIVGILSGAGFLKADKTMRRRSKSPY